MTSAQGDCGAFRPVPGWLIRMGFRISLAVVVAGTLFAVAWAACDQLAGLDAGASSAAAGVLAIMAFGLTVRLARPERPRVRHLPPAHAQPDGLRWRVGTQPHDEVSERTARSAERGRQLPEKPRITERSTRYAWDIPPRERARTLAGQHIQFIIDDAGMQVRGKRKTVGGEVWEEYLRMQWSAVTAIGFATGRHDPIVALYAWVAAGKSHHVADSLSLSHSQWTQLGELIAEATRGRLTLDVASRDDPRSIWPD
jgi:hypothetical protein